HGAAAIPHQQTYGEWDAPSYAGADYGSYGGEPRRPRTPHPSPPTHRCIGDSSATTGRSHDPTTRTEEAWPLRR
ncbi:hypothetical protein, partial [Streptomyces sp. NPDC006333]|uniref:hypothetical protein n=1 Tax=Streptomyces sp. NPDC006333 TaxID=3156753 RepID=UPI0033BF8877